jgi:hypothetical protein
MSDSGSGSSGNTTIDQQQRWNDIQELISSSNDGQQSQIWTSMPAIVKKHNDNGTIEVQPAIKQKHVKGDGNSEWLEHPPLKSVPIQYPGGGGASWTFPVKEGDEVLLCCASRNIDKWHEDGGVQEQMMPFRMHDMNDSFAIPGFRSQKRKLSEVHMKAAQLRTDDGKMVIEFDPDSKQITIKSPDKPVRIEGSLEVTGEMKTGGEIKGGREVYAHAGTNTARMNWQKSHPASQATSRALDPDAVGYWRPATNTPNIWLTASGGVAGVFIPDLGFWIAQTADPLVPEFPAVGTTPGLEGVLIQDGGKVIWHAGTGTFTYEPLPIDGDPDDPNDPINDEPWVGVLGVEVFDPTPFNVVGDVTTAITKVNDMFNISGAINQAFPELSPLINGAFKVAGILNSGNFNALLTLVPNQIGQIIGNPIVQAMIKLSTHDHHGVRAGAEISQKPVTGT